MMSGNALVGNTGVWTNLTTVLHQSQMILLREAAEDVCQRIGGLHWFKNIGGQCIINLRRSCWERLQRMSGNALVGGLHWFVNIGAQDVPRRLCPLQTPFVCSSLQGFPRCYSPLNCANVFLGLAVQRQIQRQRQRQTQTQTQTQIQRWRHHLSATWSKALHIYCAK